MVNNKVLKNPEALNPRLKTKSREPQVSGLGVYGRLSV